MNREDYPGFPSVPRAMFNTISSNESMKVFLYFFCLFKLNITCLNIKHEFIALEVFNSWEY